MSHLSFSRKHVLATYDALCNWAFRARDVDVFILYLVLYFVLTCTTVVLVLVLCTSLLHLTKRNTSRHLVTFAVLRVQFIASLSFLTSGIVIENGHQGIAAATRTQQQQQPTTTTTTTKTTLLRTKFPLYLYNQPQQCHGNQVNQIRRNN